LWFAGTSVFTFLVGLAMLAHAPKPVQPSSSASQYQAVVVAPPMHTLGPMPPLDFSGYLNDPRPRVSQFSIQERPTPVPQTQIVVQQVPVAVPQQARSGQKNGRIGTQRGGGSGGPGLSTGGS
jgi:hypothetical protein